MDGGTMPELMEAPPFTPTEPITEILHGVPVTDPYRWLEDQDSPRTREWLQQQRRYARAYLDSIPGRDRIRERIREFLAVETYDSLQRVGTRYFFRKRLPDQEQPCIYMREGADGEDQLLIDPGARGTGKYTAVKPLRVSHDGRLLLYEVKEGGERTGTFELLELETRRRLPDLLPRGYLRGFAFAPDGKSFYYTHEPLGAERPFYRGAYQHVLGTPFSEDHEIFFAGEDARIRLCLISDRRRIAFLVYHFGEKTLTDIYLKSFEEPSPPKPILKDIDYLLGLHLKDGRIFAITDRESPNRRIVEIRLSKSHDHEWVDIVPQSDVPLKNWAIADDRIYVSYLRQTCYQIAVFDLSGRKLGDVTVRDDETVRIVGGSPGDDEVVLEAESFTEPKRIFRYSAKTNSRIPWAQKARPSDSVPYLHSRVWYPSKDGTRIPMFLVGLPEVIARSDSPTIMTSYGGYGVSMTPQYSIFVAYLMEKGCLFAIPNIRGGSEFGPEWHNAARRRNRQTAIDDFLAAAEWLVQTGWTTPSKLAIFGGSNSGLLVGAAMTQRPDLFRAVLCMMPVLDMLRYHFFDGAHVWTNELGTAEDSDDFAALSKYSPYHHIKNGVAYPATIMVSGDADRNCNPLHARKMIARLQSANVSQYPILLDYSEFRGHSPVLPLGERIDGLTDRLAFICDQLQLLV
jgi:prolyl oligopeptidase